ncbi:MAG: hypothetical protein ACYCOU_07625 [Sulfobacillus sp.]
MQQFSLLLESREEADQVVSMLWDKLSIRGEIEVIPLEGKVKLDVISEKDLTPQQLEKLPGKRA